MRRRIDFWLDDTRPDDKRVLKRVEILKAKRSFRRMVLDGIMVMSQLAKGDTTLLFKLHPWIVDKILASAPPTTPNDSGDLENRIAERVEASVTAAMMNMPSLPAPPAGYPAMKSSSSAAPVIETKKAAVLSADAIADNFLLSIMQ